MANVTAEQLLEGDDLEAVTVLVPEWLVNGEPIMVTLRPLSIEQVLRANDAATVITIDKGKQVSYIDQVKQNKILIKAALVVPALTSDEIERLFKTRKAAKVTALVNAINEINELGKEDAVTEAADRFQDSDGRDGVQPALSLVEPAYDGGAAEAADDL
jgi:hypothetical protein